MKFLFLLSHVFLFTLNFITSESPKGLAVFCFPLTGDEAEEQGWVIECEQSEIAATRVCTAESQTPALWDDSIPHEMSVPPRLCFRGFENKLLLWIQSSRSYAKVFDLPSLHSLSLLCSAWLTVFLCSYCLWQALSGLQISLLIFLDVCSSNCSPWFRIEFESFSVYFLSQIVSIWFTHIPAS